LYAAARRQFLLALSLFNRRAERETPPDIDGKRRTSLFSNLPAVSRPKKRFELFFISAYAASHAACEELFFFGFTPVGFRSPFPCVVYLAPRFLSFFAVAVVRHLCLLNKNQSRRSLNHVALSFSPGAFWPSERQPDGEFASRPSWLSSSTVPLCMATKLFTIAQRARASTSL
jgi:hypothetical protein